MHRMLNRLQLRRRLSRSLALSKKRAMARAASSGVEVRKLVASRVLLREARIMHAMPPRPRRPIAAVISAAASTDGSISRSLTANKLA